MRLLHTSEFVLEEFIGSNIPKYAVISHRWGDDEASYRRFEKGLKTIRSSQYQNASSGWDKIIAACRIARSRGLDWLWIDTCCIDKKSSAELSEAINSMFNWYQRAEECYVLLPDVADNTAAFRRAAHAEEGTVTNAAKIGNEMWDPQDFIKSTWFTRAWTLQELLAPNRVLFYTTDFNCLGSKGDLQNLISDATKVPLIFITQNDMIHRASVAERMKWASRRQATREEDLAYSMLGLFGVNMPLLYGEGNKAFLRLQTEIIRTSDDETIFGWSGESHYNTNGLLAPDIAAFSTVSDIRRHYVVPRQHYEVTNKGIRITLPLRQPHLE
ncbi:hypothetical protein LTR37_016736 [Vermiconidia calcicola]|uniref:Uncharacterized protein n=1 Tax=Vermiconidia calcicola TaxID=1690605 RepID=A0ACC3MNK7_9PEZI|nr:hypothetical protein LTR37_016736 [Vermiconidia calcicola]